VSSRATFYSRNSWKLYVIGVVIVMMCCVMMISSDGNDEMSKKEL
jgi:hypothetical protein